LPEVLTLLLLEAEKLPEGSVKSMDADVVVVDEEEAVSNRRCC
jgi:hypothetical protein